MDNDFDDGALACAFSDATFDFRGDFGFNHLLIAAVPSCDPIKCVFSDVCDLV